MKKFIMSIIMIALCASASACSLNDKEDDGTNHSSAENSQNGSGLSGGNEAQGSEDSAPSLKDIRDTVAEAYGNGYRADKEMDADYISSVFGIDREYIDDAYGEYSDSSDCNHMFLSIKAKKGFGENVEDTLREYFDSHSGQENASDADKYREDSAQLYRSGDYVFYIRLGEDADKALDNAEDMAEYAKDQIKIGIDKVKSFFE